MDTNLKIWYLIDFEATLRQMRRHFFNLLASLTFRERLPTILGNSLR